MNDHDKRQIKKLKELREEYRIVCNLTQKERVKRLLEAMRGERRKEND